LIRFYGRAAIDNGFSRVAEVEAWSSNETSADNGIHWLVTDHLGTPSMIFDESGSPQGVKRHDYMPFGEELYANQFGREESQGYASGDSMRQQFTQKELDIETGLDYFSARYYSSTQGLDNRATLNGYSSRSRNGGVLQLAYHSR
jgi:hypothetical protein